MRVDEVFKQAASQGTTPVSFEMFPPKGELTLDTAREVAGNLCKLSPSFVSVTCSAGGSGNGATTAPIAHMISSEFDTPSVAHLTCVGRSHADIAAKIDEYRTAGVENILALRGDLPAGATEDDKPASDYAYARDLIPELVDAGFCVGAAAYPEGHIACEDLNLSVDGDWLRTYLLRALIRRMPEELRSDWRLTLGRLRGSIPLRLDSSGRELHAGNVYLWEEKSEDGGADWLIAYHEAFETLEEPDYAEASSCVQSLLDNAVGEAVRMKYYYDLRLTRKPETGVGFSVQEFQSYLRETDPMKLVTTMDDYLDESNEFDWEGSEEKDCDYLLDAVHAELSCPALVLAYFKNDPDLMRMLAQSGATAGTLYLNTRDRSPEGRREVRDSLRTELQANVPEAYESVGIVDGRRYAYDVFLAWDLPAVLEAAREFAEGRDDVLELGFHSLWREAGGLSIRKPEED